MVSRVCLGYIVLPYAIIYKSFDFGAMNIYIYKKNLETGEQMRKNVV